MVIGTDAGIQVIRITLAGATIMFFSSLRIQFILYVQEIATHFSLRCSREAELGWKSGDGCCTVACLTPKISGVPSKVLTLMSSTQPLILASCPKRVEMKRVVVLSPLSLVGSKLGLYSSSSRTVLYVTRKPNSGSYFCNLVQSNSLLDRLAERIFYERHGGGQRGKQTEKERRKRDIN